MDLNEDINMFIEIIDKEIESVYQIFSVKTFNTLLAECEFPVKLKGSFKNRLRWYYNNKAYQNLINLPVKIVN
jgi:hypothetical protein